MSPPSIPPSSLPPFLPWHVYVCTIIIFRFVRNTHSPSFLPSIPPSSLLRDFEKNEYELKKALLNDGVTPIENKDNGIVWAGYDSPFVYVNRHNEVWVRVA